jgi:FKBP-type peptidyl-prolyl cis-trans isomerase FklB
MRFTRALAGALLVAGCNAGGSPSLATFSDSASYAVGRRMVASLDRENAEFNIAQVLQGVRDGWNQDTAAMGQDVIADLLQRLSAETRQNREVTNMAQAEQNIAAGDAFRAEFATREGVQETDSGILYQVMTAAEGPKPGPTDTVEVHYVGTLVDGTVFDSSRERGESISFPLNQVIPGWTQALQLMSVGSTYRIVIPPQWAYGPQGAPPRIGPESTLVFEVELLGIN